jgi:Glucodextranase, domain B
MRFRVVALTLLAFAFDAPLAGATVSASRITSPAGPVFAFNDTTLSSAPQTLTVEGTFSGAPTERLDVNCYSPDGSHLTLAEGIAGAGGSFSTTISSSTLLGGAPCVLRAVSQEDFSSYPPGTESPFQGPAMAASELFESTLSGSTFDYSLLSTTLDARNEFQSAGACGLTGSHLYQPSTLAESQGSFHCVAALYGEEPIEGGEPSRSEIKVDGLDAYAPYAAQQLFGAEPGIPSVGVSDAFDPATGLITIQETDPLVACSPDPKVFPPTAGSCSSFQPVGVLLQRTWKTEDSGRTVSLRDGWLSTDGASHSLDLLYDERFQGANAGAGGFSFPGSSGFSDYPLDSTITVPSGPGSIAYEEDREGNGGYPFSAITYSSPPDGPVTFTHSDTAEAGPDFVMPYQRTIPAGGEATVRMGFEETHSLSDLEASTEEVIAAYSPTLTIASPITGTLLKTPTAIVSGTVSGQGTTPTLTLDGSPLAVNPDGTFSSSLTLQPGANALVLTATGEDGLTKTEEVLVTYLPASEPPAEEPPAKETPAEEPPAKETPAEEPSAKEPTPEEEETLRSSGSSPEGGEGSSPLPRTPPAELPGTDPRILSSPFQAEPTQTAGTPAGSPPPEVYGASIIGGVRASRRVVTYTVACRGPRGASCKIASSLQSRGGGKRGGHRGASIHHGVPAEPSARSITELVPAGQRAKVTIARAGGEAAGTSSSLVVTLLVDREHRTILRRRIKG